MALREYVTQPDSCVVEELILHLTAPRIVEQGGTKRGTARAWLAYLPADGKGGAQSPEFDFTAPLGPIEAEELSWYLERFIRWPGEAFRSRAEKVEAALPVWGRKLFDATLGVPQAMEILTAWENAPHARRMTVQLHDAPPPELDMEEWDDALKHRMAAAAHLLTLPWELLHDRQGYLFHRGARVRRGVPVSHPLPGHTAPLPLLVLLLSPRPVEKGTGYIDHRIAAKPLLETMARLGDMAELVILPEPSFPALMTALRQAKQADKPFHVVHFDGHGVFDLEKGRGSLCFEKPGQEQELLDRRQDLVDARKLANGLSRFSLPLVFLEACQSGQAEANPVSSVAAALLEAGVGAVVAMSHSVLVETARQFMPRFYEALAHGAQVGEAMLVGQGRLGEARAEIRRAIVCKEPFGHAAEPWKTWSILSAIEAADHQPEAAAQARQQARALFAQYRRDGGENHAGGAQLCQAVAAALSQGAGEQVREQLEQMAQQLGLDSGYQALVPVLLAILAGERDSVLAESPGLDYELSVEVELLLEGLARTP